MGSPARGPSLPTAPARHSRLNRCLNAVRRPVGIRKAVRLPHDTLASSASRLVLVPGVALAGVRRRRPDAGIELLRRELQHGDRAGSIAPASELTGDCRSAGARRARAGAIAARSSTRFADVLGASTRTRARRALRAARVGRRRSSTRCVGRARRSRSRPARRAAGGARRAIQPARAARGRCASCRRRGAGDRARRRTRCSAPSDSHALARASPGRARPRGSSSRPLRSITSRSMPIADAAGGRHAVLQRASSPRRRAGSPRRPAAWSARCCSKRARCSSGSFSSVKALANSMPAAKHSKRSTSPGSERWSLANGDSSIG